MTGKTLEQLYAEHAGKVSDKWSLYFHEYDRILDPYRNKPVNLLEIGIQNGGSLEIWSKYFSHAKKIIGCDINPECASLKFKDPRIAVVVGNANTDTAQAEIMKNAPAFDAIIDDGSHRSGDIIRSFARYFPHLADGGIFIAEDLHCSYWKEFEGGLFDPFSSITFFKRLADVINHEHWGVNKTGSDILNGFFSKYGFRMDMEALRHVHSIEFINSICVIRKEKPARNTLGKRIISGSEGAIISKQVLHSSLAPVPDETKNEWTVRSMPPDEELLPRVKELAASKTQIINLKKAVNERDIQIMRLDQAVVQCNEKIGSLNQAVAERNGQITSLNQVVAERNKKIGNLSQVITEQNGQIAVMRNELDGIYRSRKWKIMIKLEQFVFACLDRIVLLNKPFVKRRPQQNDADCINNSGLFDAKWYISQYPDVAKAKVDPLWHYLNHGASEGRNPGPKFDTSWYLQHYPDAARSGMNPLVHYVRHGKKAGFKTSAVVSPAKIKDVPRAVIGSSSYPSGISIIIPTYNGGWLFKRALYAIANQDFSGARELIVVDSGSKDSTIQLAEAHGAIVKHIPNREFHHSRTRQWALSFAHYDRIVYMVQDTTLATKHILNILNKVLDKHTAGAYGRPLPYEDADLFSRFETENHSEYLGDSPRIQGSSSGLQGLSYHKALYECRFDNVCAIYWHKALDNIPFPEVPYAEDIAWARTVIEKGMHIRYSPEIQVLHSHNRPASYRLKRGIVDTIACAQILGQVEQDLRPAGTAEIMALEEFSARLLDAKMRSIDTEDHMCAEKLWEMGNIGRQIASLMGRQTADILNRIAKKYPNATNNEIRSCIPQAVALSQGIIIGQIYASYLLNEGVPTILDEYIRPFMAGV